MGKERLDKELMIQVGNRLRAIRKDRGFQQEKVMFNTRIKVGRYERAEVNISLTTLSVLCNYYDISLKDFFDGIKTK